MPVEPCEEWGDSVAVVLSSLIDLFDEVCIGPVCIRNRIAMAPMGQHQSGPDGRARPWHFVHYGSRAVGGCGFIMFEDTAVAPGGRVSERGLGLYDDSQVETLRQITDFCGQAGAKVGIQLSHAGPKAFRDAFGHGHDLVSVGNDPFEAGWAAPRVLAGEELTDVVLAFASAARRAFAAGFDVVEIHATHGYLIHEFLSPLRNQRDDEFGGELARRARLLLEVIRATRDVCPEGRIVGVRLPAKDGHVHGLQPADIAELANLCAGEGVELIALAGTLSSTGAVAQPEDYAVTGRAARTAGIEHLMYSARLATADGTNQLSAPSQATLVAVGRPLLLDPYWAIHLGQRCGAELEIPVPYQAG
jgi:2,4-dienoyl-CoA reductase-like NADH-dependent reductase (Old Yellow Enzyme family)